MSAVCMYYHLLVHNLQGNIIVTYYNYFYYFAVTIFVEVNVMKQEVLTNKCLSG
jgi:hypothetical protein